LQIRAIGDYTAAAVLAPELTIPIAKRIVFGIHNVK